MQPKIVDIDSASVKNDLDLLHDIGSRLAAADPLHAVLARVVHLVAHVTAADACFIYVLEDADLVLRASKTPHPDLIDRLKLRVEGMAAWVADLRQPLAVGARACDDARVRPFTDPSEERVESCLVVPLLSRRRVVGAITVQHRQPHVHTPRETQVVSMAGYLVGAEIARARLEADNAQLSERLEERKVVDRAKGILQRELGLSEEEAYVAIQRQSRQRRKSKKDIAEAIIIAEELRLSGDHG